MTDNGTADYETALRVVQERYATLDRAARDTFHARLKMDAMAEAAPEAFEPPVHTLTEYLAMELPHPPALVSGHTMVAGGLTTTIARAGRGKTSGALNRLLRWGAGEPWLPTWRNPQGVAYMTPTRPLRSLIIENEGAAGMFQDQLRVMLAAPNLSDKERALAMENVMVWGDGGWSGLKLDNERQLDEIRAGCERHKPDIVLIEPFRGLWTGEENSATDMAVVADALSGIASDYLCAVWVTHHERKAGTGEDGEKMSAGRGSTVLEGVAATIENFDSVASGAFRELSWSKLRYETIDEPKPAPVRLKWDLATRWYAHEAENNLVTKFCDVLQTNDPEPMTIKDLAEATGETAQKLRTVASQAIKGADAPVVRMSAIRYAEGGSSGHRYRLKTTAGGDGMAI